MNTAENLMKKKMVFKTELDKLTSNSDVLWRRATDRLAEIMTKYGSLPKGVQTHTSRIFPAAAIYLTVKTENGAEKAYSVVENGAIMNAQLPKAQAEADKKIQNAEYLKQKRINEAIQQVAMFEAMYAEYAQNPSITRSRMYYETISQILPDVKLFINSGDGSNVQSLLPLDSLVTTNGGEQ